MTACYSWRWSKSWITTKNLISIRRIKMEFRQCHFRIRRWTTTKNESWYAKMCLQMLHGKNWWSKGMYLQKIHNELKRRKGPFWQDNSLFDSKAFFETFLSGGCPIVQRRPRVTNFFSKNVEFSLWDNCATTHLKLAFFFAC